MPPARVLLLLLALVLYAPACADDLADLLRALSQNNATSTSCDGVNLTLRNCMTAATTGDALQCTKCLTAGLLTTVPIACPALAAPSYCTGVVGCVERNCDEGCWGAYYASVNCALGPCDQAADCGEEVAGEAARRPRGDDAGGVVE